MWGKFPSGGPPPPSLGIFIFFTVFLPFYKPLNWKKTEKSMEWVWVRPFPPLWEFVPHNPVFFLTTFLRIDVNEYLLFTIWSWIKDDIKQVFLFNTISLSHRVWAIFVLFCSEIELMNRDFSLWFDQTNNLYLCTTSLDIVLGIPWSENCFPFSSLV